MFGAPTLNSILSGFNKTLKDLDTFTGKAVARVEAIDQKIESLESEGASLATDIAKANEVKANINRLLGKHGD